MQNSRKVDVPALFSHAFRGDGALKCRICLDETKEGSVLLSDSVFLKDELPLTLATVLTEITSETFEEEDINDNPGLPSSVCSSCVQSALAALNFISLVQESNRTWERAVLLLDSVNICPLQKLDYNTTSAYLILSEQNKPTLLQDKGIPATDKKTALLRLQTLLGKKVPRHKNLNDIPVKKEPSSEYIAPSHRRWSKFNVQCTCPDCEETFTHTRLLAEHLSTSHVYACCNLCGTVTCKGVALQEHMLSAHRLSYSLCDQCPLIFESDKALEWHNASRHSPGEQWCTSCGVALKGTRHQLHHLDTAHRARPCEHPQCTASFNNRPCWKAHKKTCRYRKVLPKKSVLMSRYDPFKGGHFECDYCHQVFKTKAIIYMHIRNIHEKLQKYQCSICGKRYRVRAELDAHLNAHQGIKPFSCDICGQKFSSKKSAANHRRLHTNERPYPCLEPTCQEAFINASRRLYHMRSSHGWEQSVVGRGGLLPSTAAHACPLRDCQSVLSKRQQLKRHLMHVHHLTANDAHHAILKVIRRNVQIEN